MNDYRAVNVRASGLQTRGCVGARRSWAARAQRGSLVSDGGVHERYSSRACGAKGVSAWAASVGAWGCLKVHKECAGVCVRVMSM